MPRPGVGEAAAERALFGRARVASVEPAGAVSGALREGLGDFAAIIWVVIAIAVVLVLLIAFNSTAIAADERAREHATMFAYGLPVRTVLRLAVVESLIMGLLATALGIALGIAILGWVVNVNLKEVLPELGVVVVLAPSSIVLALLCGAGRDGRGAAADGAPPAPHGRPVDPAHDRVGLTRTHRPTGAPRLGSRR